VDDKLTISTFQLFQMFPDQEAARVYLEARRWPQGPVCPVCQKGDRITTREGGFYRCNACKEDFTVRTGTIFERSHKVPYGTTPEPLLEGTTGRDAACCRCSGCRQCGLRLAPR
jgi:hypothetical protein